MSFQTYHLPYRDTHSFSKLVYDYLSNTEALRPYYAASPTLAGIKQAMEKKKFSPEGRAALVAELNRRYSGLDIHPSVKQNLHLLEQENCFTVCTAHQPNIFTGHLYFVYKILQAIRLAEKLKAAFPKNEFVPVYFMGSEDADLNELGEVFFAGDKMNWQTKQQGAIGRMKVDKGLLNMIDAISGMLDVLPHGKEVTDLLKRNYVIGHTIEHATFTLVNELFGKYGLIILLPDANQFKQLFVPVMERELREQFSAKAMAETLHNYPQPFKIESFGRDINLFYLDENGRNRIERDGDDFLVVNTSKQFSLNEIVEDLHRYPEKYSPNVILRPALQEALLPNIAFIGGGGELAYWLRLKLVFETCGIDFPVLFLRNSFMLINKKSASVIHKLGLDIPQLFLDEQTISNEWIKKHADVQLNLKNEIEDILQAYKKMQQVSGTVDTTLAGHAKALGVKAIKELIILEKKMLRAEKRKHNTSLQQIHKLKSGLFPGGLQERIENIMPWLAVYGFGFIDSLLNFSPDIDPSFTVVEER